MAAGLVHIDGRGVPFQQGQTVLQAALAAGVNIPHLCYHPELRPIGSCRVCLVEADGRTLSACTLPATDGQAVRSDTPRLRKLRTGVLALLLEQGQHICIRCERSGDCRLQQTAAALDVSALGFSKTLDIPARDDSHPEVALERGRCILCGICIQASRELDGKNLFAFAGSGGNMSLAVASASGLLKDSGISAKDHAVRLCPVGALVPKSSPAEFQEFPSFDFFD